MPTPIEEAQAFWLREFRVKNQPVNFRHFEESLRTFMDIRPSKAFEKALRMTIEGLPSHTDSDELLVTSQDFALVLYWFGPLSGGFRDRVVHTFKAPWFFAHMDSAQAADLLVDQEVGTYLVRFSSQVLQFPGCFTISVKTSEKISHSRLEYKTETHRYRRGEKSYLTLAALLQDDPQLVIPLKESRKRLVSSTRSRDASSDDFLSKWWYSKWRDTAVHFDEVSAQLAQLFHLSKEDTHRFRLYLYFSVTGYESELSAEIRFTYTSLAALSAVEHWFGSLQRPDEVFAEMTATFNLPYFFGHFDGKIATAWLSDCPAGTFLLRFSSQQMHSGCFVLSRVTTDGRISHMRFQRQSSGKILTPAGQIYGSITELVRQEPDCVSPLNHPYLRIADIKSLPWIDLVHSEYVSILHNIQTRFDATEELSESSSAPVPPDVDPNSLVFRELVLQQLFKTGVQYASGNLHCLIDEPHVCPCPVCTE